MFREFLMTVSDDRVKEILTRAREENKAKAERIQASAEAQKQKKEFVAELKAKWAVDTHIIQAAVREIEEKLDAENVQIAFQSGSGNPGTTVAQAHFNGRSGNKTPGTMAFNVFETGMVSVYFDSQKATGHFKLLDADAETYKNQLLTLAERLIFPGSR
jgi:hypothetical protein